MKKFFSEFKEFISKGDVVSMAVGIIVGGAFTAIVNALVQDIISPLLGLITGGIDFSGISFGFRGAQFLIGDFINAVISFLLTAFVLFLIIKFLNGLNKGNEELIGKLKKVVKTGNAKKDGAAEAQAEEEAPKAEEKAADEEAKAEENKASELSSGELEILMEIRDLLREKK